MIDELLKPRLGDLACPKCGSLCVWTKRYPPTLSLVPLKLDPDCRESGCIACGWVGQRREAERKTAHAPRQTQAESDIEAIWQAALQDDGGEG